MFFSFPEDAHWNSDLQALEFGVSIGDYEGVVRVPRDVFRRFIDDAVSALKPIICNEPALNLSPSGSCGAANRRTTAAMLRSLAAISATAWHRMPSPHAPWASTGLHDEGRPTGDP